MNQHLKSYLWFLAFGAVTAILVRPIISKLNVPLLDAAVQ